MLQYQFRTLENWPGEQTKHRKTSQFGAAWQQTMQLLEKELRFLDGQQVVIQLAVAPEGLRIDGKLRANAKPDWPGVILSFKSKFGELSYPCDRYLDWQDNLRAIALSLHALRAVERYGVTRRAEQYQGWQKLPPPDSVNDQFRAAVAVLCAFGAYSTSRLRSIEDSETIYREACRATHPDTGGNANDFKKVQAAKKIIDDYFEAHR